MLYSAPERHRPSRWRRLGLLIPAAATAAAAAVVFIGGPGPPVPTSAAAVLDRAAEAAAQKASLTLHPGEYVYTRIRALSDDSVGWGNGISFSTEYVYTDQTWKTTKGTGREMYTRDTRVTIDPSTRAGWIKAGRPNMNKGGHRTTRRAADGVPLLNLSRLPADPATLKREIERGKTGLEDVQADVEDPSTPGGAFYVCLILLSEPSYDGSAALRSALFKVMASLPGDKLIGRVKTRSGRSGVGILTPPLGPGRRDVFKVILDPKTGAILEYDEYARSGAVAEQWTEFLATGIVHKVGQLPQHR